MQVSRLALAIALTVGCPCTLFAQIVDYDWAARSLQDYPTNITQTRSASVRVHNVNDVLYSYTVKSECTQNQTDPFGSIVGLLPATSPPPQADLGPAPSACQKALAAAQAAVPLVAPKINAMISEPTTDSGCSSASPCDVPLSATQQYWDNNIESSAADADEKVKTAGNACSSDAATADAIQDLKDQIVVIDNTRTKVKHTTHDYSVTVTLIPDSSCQLTITQRYGQTQTQNGSVTATFSPGQPRMSLSAGPLFSEVQDRSYSVVSVPSGSTTESVLQFNGNSRFTTYLTGLLNFHIPSSTEWINGERAGIALSTGPVLRVGGQSSASAFGWFGGISYHINHLVFITAGLHAGQFAGNPAGFSSPNQVVPSNFPTPTAQNRTTIRFALAITVKAKDFSKLSSGTSSPGAGSPAPTGGNPAPGGKH